MSELHPTTTAEILNRAGSTKRWVNWQEETKQTGFCHQPIRLKDGARSILKACGNRREAVCPPCSERYRSDTWQLVAAGLQGGKAVPSSISEHPMVFATFTAPSFGAVHSAHKINGRAQVCTKRTGKKCPHGQPVGCWQKHSHDEAYVGEPLCSRCFDYQRAVLWNALAPELWRRTTIYIKRALAKEAGLTQAELDKQVSLSYLKVTEYQRRGAIHYHAVIRLDAKTVEGQWHSPPPSFTSQVLMNAVRAATEQVSVPSPLESSQSLGWGKQLDLKSIESGGQSAPERAAGYIAKYATKATEAVGGPAHRVNDYEIKRLHLREHVGCYLKTAWQLGAKPELKALKLRRWAHTLGYRGHCTTKSRRYSTTLTALRQARVNYRRHKDSVQQTKNCNWRYDGRHSYTHGELLLLVSSFREKKRTARVAKDELRSGARMGEPWPINY